MYKALAGRTVTFYPDHGYHNRVKKITCYNECRQRVHHIRQRIAGNFTVSNEVEDHLHNQPREDWDLADILLIRDADTGIVLNGNGYPLLWDLNYGDYGVESDGWNTG